jgi:two-component system chemotaxis sensor kinase CheA
MVLLEQRTNDTGLLGSIFRSIHTLKGTCGFLGLATIEGLSHRAETILDQLRSSERELTPALVSLILQTVDAIKVELASVEKNGRESGAVYEKLLAKLDAAAENAPAETPASRAPDTPAPDADAAAGWTPAASESTIRVDVGLLDKLMNLVGELVLARNQILQFSMRHEDASLNATSQRLNLITSELQEGVMKTRMQPIGTIWNKLPRVVRDVAAGCGKQIQLEMEGADTELDRTILEAIKDPLTHIIRNACDHGIESPEDRRRAGKPATGRLFLRAFHEGGNVNIEISDDGRGIDAQKVRNKAILSGLLREEQAARMSERDLANLIFLPGFTTATQVTSISGRGVGMDVVKTNVEKIGGTVDLNTELGVGTTFRIKIPLTLAIIPGLVVTAKGNRFVLPQACLVELVRLEGNDIRKQVQWIARTPLLPRRGRLLPLAFLDQVLELTPAGQSETDVLNIVILQAEERQFGLIVDSVNDTQEIVVKPLGKQLKKMECYAGATIMGDGHVALILDVIGVSQRSGVVGAGRNAVAESTGRSDMAADEKSSMLLFKAGGFERLAVPLSLVARLEEVPLKRIEQAGGKTVVQYRSRLLPLVSLESTHSFTSDPVTVIVFASGEQRLGLMVDEILDIVEETIMVRKASTTSGLLGSAVIGNRVTDILDLQYVIRSAGEKWFAPNETANPLRILSVDSSAFSQALVRTALEMEGFYVSQAQNSREALVRLGRQKFDLLLIAVEPEAESATQFLQTLRRNPEYSQIPAVAVRASSARCDLPTGFSSEMNILDRDRMIQSIQRLAEAIRGEHASQRQVEVMQ